MEQQINIFAPDSLLQDARKAAEAEGISLDQFCALAIARAVGEWESSHFFASRGGGLTTAEARKRLESLLARVKD